MLEIGKQLAHEWQSPPLVFHPFSLLNSSILACVCCVCCPARVFFPYQWSNIFYGACWHSPLFRDAFFAFQFKCIVWGKLKKKPFVVSKRCQCTRPLLWFWTILAVSPPITILNSFWWDPKLDHLAQTGDHPEQAKPPCIPKHATFKRHFPSSPGVWCFFIVNNGKKSAVQSSIFEIYLFWF